MTTEIEMKKYFEKTQKLAIKWAQTKKELDNMMSSYYGETHYSDKDKDYIIDALDYGCGGCTWKYFNKTMKEINHKDYLE